MKTPPESTTSSWRRRNLWMLELFTLSWLMEPGLLKELRRNKIMLMELVSCVELQRLELNTSGGSDLHSMESSILDCRKSSKGEPRKATNLLASGWQE
eukprot:8230109-Heterocapsa_arctica.AAC.1